MKYSLEMEDLEQKITKKERECQLKAQEEQNFLNEIEKIHAAIEVEEMQAQTLAIENDKKIKQMRDEVEEIKEENANTNIKIKNRLRQEQEIREQSDNLDNEIERLESMLRGEY